MPYTLKSTGLAAEAISIIAVDEDGTTIRDFKSPARTAAMVIHEEVTRGTSSWKETSRNFFRTLNDGDFNFKGIDFTDAQTIPWNNSTGAPGTGTFIAYAGADLARGNGAILAQPALGGLRISGGKLANSYGGGTGRGTTTIPSDLVTKFSAGMNFVYGGAEQWFYGLESGEIVADGSESDAGFGANNPLRYLGGDPGQGTAPGKFHVIVIVPRPLTLAEYQSLHDDWFGTLFEASVADTTAPTLTSPTSTPTGTTTASGSVSTDEGNGTLYYLASVNATETAATVKAGGATGGSQAVTSTGSKAVSVTGLTASTLYYLHFVHRDAAGNDSARVSSASFTTSAAGDTTAPTLSSPTATQTGQTTASGSVSTNEANGTLYRYVSTNAVESAATVKAANLTQAVAATGVQNVTFTGLTSETTYYAHYVHRDAAGNDSTVANSASFTTAAAVTGTITSDEFRNWSGDLLIGLTVENVVVLTMNRTLALTLTNQVTNGEGRVVIANNAALVSGTDYMLASYSPDGEDRGFKKVRAT